MSVRKKLLSFLLNFFLKESQKDPNPVLFAILRERNLSPEKRFLAAIPYFINKGRKIKKNRISKANREKYRMEWQTHNKIPEVVRTALCLFLLSMLFFPEIKAQTTSYTKAESFLFSFKENNDMFLADYGDNAYQLERMGQQLPFFRKRLLAESCHLLIISHVSAYDSEEDVVINVASLRANRIRAYLKTRLDIPGECVAFYIDRSGSYRDRTHVYLVESPLPWFANTAIRYSESRYPNAVREALEKYGAIPYADLFRRGEVGGYDREVYRIDDPLFDRSELEDYRLASVVDTLIYSARQSTVITTHEKMRIVRKDVPVEGVPAEHSDPVVTDSRQPVPPIERTPVYMSVKTNLLPWFSVVPSVLLGAGDVKVQTGSFMPNIELECYFSDRWSVAVSGMYSDFSYKDKTRDRWSVSEFSVEPRVWPLAPGKYTWLNAGLFGEYGDFDVRGNAIDPDKDVLYGRTGRFWTVGASIGCLVPLGKGFCTEVSVRTGYRSVFEGKKYRYDKIDDTNYLESRFSSTGFMVGLEVSLVYRFRIR